MIEELPWDSDLFGRKIGRLKAAPAAEELGGLLKRAASEGFRYLSCRIPAIGIEDIQLLESHGFYVSDVSILWSRHPGGKEAAASTIRAAISSDKDAVVRISRGIFTDGRFYHDPFFSREEADRLYEAWAANLFAGLADRVFIAGEQGFIGCALRGRAGDIPLIGVAAGSQGRGIGTALINHALAWFRTQGVNEVTVRTQAGNRQAVRLYERCGFSVKEADVTLGRALVR